MSQAPPESSIEHRFGEYGGQYVPETLMPALAELEQAWIAAREDPAYRSELDGLLRDFAGRPTPLYRARRLSERAGRTIYLKREDLNHTGSHKLNNALGQVLLAKRMGKRRIIAETGAGQHGVATATVCALLGLECMVYMGVEDTRRQRPNVQRMQLLGASVQPVDAGARTLKEATSAAIRDWVTQRPGHPLRDRLGRRAGAVPGARARPAARHRRRGARADPRARGPAAASASSPASAAAPTRSGIFAAFLDDAEVELVGVEAGGEGIDTGRHGAPLTVGARPGILHGSRSAVMQDEEGQIVAGALDLRRARLSRRRAAARLPARQRPRALCGRGPTRRARRLPRGRAPGGDHPGAGDRPRAGVGARPARGRARPRVPLRARRQGPRRGARQGDA